MSNYCRANPGDQLAAASAELIKDLRPKAHDL
jgi:hypothetical protein